MIEFSPFHTAFPNNVQKKGDRWPAQYWFQKKYAYISQGSRYEGLDASFCALQMYEEHCWEADSCRLWADSPKCPVVIICDTFHEVKLWPWDTANWTIPVIPYSHIEVSGVKVLKILIKWHKILVWKHAQGYVARKMSASVPKSFPLKRKNWVVSKQNYNSHIFLCQEQWQPANTLL